MESAEETAHPAQARTVATTKMAAAIIQPQPPLRLISATFSATSSTRAAANSDHITNRPIVIRKKVGRRVSACGSDSGISYLLSAAGIISRRLVHLIRRQIAFRIGTKSMLHPPGSA
jgi:hypothetical protein